MGADSGAVIVLVGLFRNGSAAAGLEYVLRRESCGRVMVVVKRYLSAPASGLPTGEVDDVVVEVSNADIVTALTTLVVALRS